MARALRLGDQAACGVDSAVSAGSAGEGHGDDFREGYGGGGAVAGVNVLVVGGRGGCGGAGGCGGDGVGVGGVYDGLDGGGGVAEVGEEGGAD